MVLKILLVLVMAYLIGSIPFGLLVVKTFQRKGHQENRKWTYRRNECYACRRVAFRFVYYSF